MYAEGPFADAIDRLLTDSQLRRRMGRAAESYIRDRHDLNQNYQKMESVLKDIIYEQ